MSKFTVSAVSEAMVLAVLTNRTLCWIVPFASERMSEQSGTIPGGAKTRRGKQAPAERSPTNTLTHLHSHAGLASVHIR